jgi:hypothetical protein
MSFFKITKKVSKRDLAKLLATLGNFANAVVDVENGALILGGTSHSESEKILLEAGSRQEDLWGGNIDLTSRTIYHNAPINIRPNLNNESPQIADPIIRAKFSQAIKQKFRW